VTASLYTSRPWLLLTLHFSDWVVEEGKVLSSRNSFQTHCTNLSNKKQNKRLRVRLVLLQQTGWELFSWNCLGITWMKLPMETTYITRQPYHASDVWDPVDAFTASFLTRCRQQWPTGVAWRCCSTSNTELVRLAVENATRTSCAARNTCLLKNTALSHQTWRLRLLGNSILNNKVAFAAAWLLTGIYEAPLTQPFLHCTSSVVNTSILEWGDPG